MFGEWDSLFHTRYKCLNIIKEDEDFVAYTGKINAQCERFKLKDLKEDMFKCLIFVQGLTSNKDEVIRSKILTMLEQDTEKTLQKVSEECQKLINIRLDNICYLISLYTNKESTRFLWFCGGGEGSGHALSKSSKGTLLPTFTDPFSSTIYSQSFITIRAAVTKIPYLLYEKTHLKPRMEWIVLFVIIDGGTKIMGMVTR